MASARHIGLPISVRWISAVCVLALLALPCALPLFRCFITMDGPMHVLHASVLEEWLTATHYWADGITYNGGALRLHLGDVLMMVLLRVFSPQSAHVAFATLTLIMLTAAWLACVRSYGAPLGVHVLLFAPLGLCFLLVMGFLHFLLGTALCLFALAGWRQFASRPWHRWGLLVVAFATAWATHRAAPMLLLVLVAADLLVSGLSNARTTHPRRAGARSYWWVSAGLGVVAVWLLASSFATTFTVDAQASDDRHHELWLMRPFLLLGREKEMPFIVPMVLVWSAATVAALIDRWRAWSRIEASDALLLSGVAFAAGAIALDRPVANALYVVERCQWLALVLVTAWLAVRVPRASPGVAWLLRACALACMPLHALRVRQTESEMYLVKDKQRCLIEASEHLQPNSLVVVIDQEETWTLDHLAAYAACRHNGVFFTTSEHLPFGLPKGTQKDQMETLLRSSDATVLNAHIAAGLGPVVDQILLFGGTPEGRRERLGPLRQTLDRHFWRTWDNGYAVLYTFDPGRIDAYAEAPGPTTP